MKTEKRFWLVVALVFVAILVWHITSAMVPSLAAGVKAMTPFLIAFVTAYLLRHPVIWTEKLLHLICRKKEYKWQHTIASIFVLAVFLGIITAVVASILPGLLNNINDIVQKLPSFVNEVVIFAEKTVKDLSDRLDADTSQMITETVEILGNELLKYISSGAKIVVSTVTDIVAGTMSFIVDFALYLVATFLLLHGYDSIKRTLKNCMRIFIKESEKYDETCAFLHDCDVIVEKYIVVRLVTSLGIGIISYIGFLLFGLPYSLLLALVIAVTNLIPYIGPFVGAVPVVLIALATKDLSVAIWVSVFMLAVQQIEGNILTPLLTSDALEVSPLLVLVGIAVFGAMMGIPGMLLGAPIVAIISGLVKRAVLIAKKKAEKKEN